MMTRRQMFRLQCFAWESIEELRQFILRGRGRTDIVAPPSQIAADLLTRRA